MLMLAESSALPPLPLQVRMNVEFAVKPLMLSVPDVALFPDHPPDASQSLARWLLQLIVVEPFTGTVVELADTDSAGGFGPLTETSTVSLIFLPLYAIGRVLREFAPASISVQASSKVLFATSELIVSVPDVFLSPDQSPSATQSSTRLVVQLKVTLPS